METFKADFEPIGRRGSFEEGISLIEISRRLGIGILSTCGGRGICGDCLVQLLEGEISPITEKEKALLSNDMLTANYRLACHTYPRTNCKVNVPIESLSSPMRAQVDGYEVDIDFSPAFDSKTIHLTPPSLEDATADAERVFAEFGSDAFDVDFEVVRELPTQLRQLNWDCKAYFYSKQLIGLLPLNENALGIAVDLGSTGIAGYLVDLDTGKTLLAHGMMNPQISYGEDIISRIVYANRSDGNRDQIRQVILDGLNNLIGTLCDQTDNKPEQIMDMVIVGNTAMHHLLLGLPTYSLATSPFVPAIHSAHTFKGREIGLHLAPGASVYLPPNVAGFVGADHIAMLAASKDEWKSGGVLAIDIGTNTEISLIDHDLEVTSVSCASGPAFEGYQIKDGTRARLGAIEKVHITSSNVFFETIGGDSPAGICGSGILDAVAQLHVNGILDEGGRFVENSHTNLFGDKDNLEFILVRQNNERNAISVNQKDIRAIQLAKSSIQSGIEILLKEGNLEVGDIQKVLIAGAFGSYIDISNAINIGMLPDIQLSRYRQIGNAAGVGAKYLLSSIELRAQTQILRERIRYIELAHYAGFSRVFALNCKLKPFRRVQR